MWPKTLGVKQTRLAIASAQQTPWLTSANAAIDHHPPVVVVTGERAIFVANAANLRELPRGRSGSTPAYLP